MKQQVYFCDCYSPEHQMVFNPSPLEDEEMIYVHIHLVRYSFWKRLVHGIKYIFGYQSRYGAFNEIILGPQHSKQLLEASKYLNPKEHEEYLERTYKAWHGVIS